MPKNKKLPSTFINMAMVLTLIALVSALGLSFTYTSTKEAIAQVEIKRTLTALKQVLPEFDNNPYDEMFNFKTEKELEFFPAKRDNQLVGTAVKTYSDKGFNERVWLMVGFDKNNRIYNISVIKHAETPGLGTKMANPKFKNQFKGKDPAVFKLKIIKDGGAIDAITAATISSRAFCDALDKAYRTLTGGDQK